MVESANNKRSESIQTRDPIALMEYVEELQTQLAQAERCLLYTSDAADE